MAQKESWEVEPYSSAGPFVAGCALHEVIEVLGEEPRRVPRSMGRGERCLFPEHGVVLHVDGEGVVEEIEWVRGGPITPAYRGVKLLGNWTMARTKLAALGLDTPDPDRRDEQTFHITDGLTAWIRFERVTPDSICARLVRPSAEHP